MNPDCRVLTLLERVETLLRAEVSSADAEAEESLFALLMTGRRIRARMVVETAVAGNSDEKNDDAIVSGAAAIELLHVSSLIHDDLIDASIQRRGAPTVHAAHGDARAVLLGNLLTVRGLQHADRIGPIAVTTLMTAVERLNRGQLLESELSPGDEEGFLRYISLKTASLVEAACIIGSITAGDDFARVSEMAAFGWNFGMMFQMIDDICDFSGSEQTLGKPVHQDLHNRVYTLPIQSAIRQEPSLGERIARHEIASTYERMATVVNMPEVMQRWRIHADAAQAHLRTALGPASSAWLSGLSVRYSVDVLHTNGIVAAEAPR